MLIPQECHKPAFQIDGPILQRSNVAVVPLAKLKQAFGTKQHEEKSHKRKRKFRYLLEDSSEISDEALQEDESCPSFSAFLHTLTEVY